MQPNLQSIVRGADHVAAGRRRVEHDVETRLLLLLWLVAAEAVPARMGRQCVGPRQRCGGRCWRRVLEVRLLEGPVRVTSSIQVTLSMVYKGQAMRNIITIPGHCTESLCHICWWV